MQKNLGLIQQIVRFYTFYTPVKKGKHRLAVFAKKLVKNIPEQLMVTTKDGRKLIVNPKPTTYEKVYFLGEYEPDITEIINKIVRPGDICLDIGANIGWYSTLLQKKVGSGQVYAFEPVPATFKILERNVQLNFESENISLSNIALGDEEKEVDIYLFDDLPDGHASLDKGENNKFQSFRTRMATLDSFIEENKIGEITFIKADIEGAELMMLKGARKLFDQKIPPMLEIEMALATTRGFGYLPNDLLEFINSQGNYDFYRINEQTYELTKFQTFPENDIGANVLCIPSGFYQDRIKELRIVR